MIYRDYLIIGAGLSGASVCEGIREHDRKGTVTLVGAESFLPYNRPPLSKEYLKSPKLSVENFYHLDAAWYEKNHIELRLDTMVTQFNIERHLAVLRNGQTIEFRKACLATGSRPRRPPVAGANLGNVFYLGNCRDAMAIREIAAIQKHVVVIGGGFIAAETSASLTEAKCNVTMMNRDQFLWQQWLDMETARWLTTYFADHGVTLMMQENLNGFEGKTILKNIQTKSGSRFAAGMALVAIGADPNIELVQHTPLGTPNGTPVNEYLETDEKGIYATGDIALFPDKLFNGVRRVRHWDNARVQGRIAGANMTGKKRIKFDCVPWFFSDLFDLKFQFVGDFGYPPGPASVKLEGDRKKKCFIARYYQGTTICGIVLCNQPREKAQAARAEIRERNK
jgi:NADPH-dependent 2,4-dienoyl-CoA reductase/sulfur reductase-like enzyme